jgi:hypothetical protein
VSRANEAYMPPELVLRVLASAGDDVVLVGGQALAFWMDRFGVRHPAKLPAVSRDVDFFTPNAANSAPLKEFARAIQGKAVVLPPEAVTALIGSAVAPADQDRVYNVDLLHSVTGLSRAEIGANAVLVTLEGLPGPFRVMHPLHVLQSRNANLHELREKQDNLGRLQLQLAIEVCLRFLEAEFDHLEEAGSRSAQESDRAMLDLVAAVSDYAGGSAAKKNAERHGIFLADAIPAWRIRAPAFWEKQWPRMRGRMSPAHAALCEQRAGLAR